MFRLGAWVDNHGVDAAGPYRAARDLLLRRSPRLINGADTLILPDESTVDVTKRIGTLLDYSVLGIQGPAGSGKTFTGARMICELVRQGKKVGITATSHKVIRNLLFEVIKAANEAGFKGFNCLQKVKEKTEYPTARYYANDGKRRAAYGIASWCSSGRWHCLALVAGRILRSGGRPFRR